LRTSHRVSGLVQRNAYRKTCGRSWALRDILAIEILQKSNQINGLAKKPHLLFKAGPQRLK